jgi:hypothetical protein
MTKADLKKAHNALQHIKSKPEVLENLDVALTKFRHHVGEDLDDVTYNYVLNALLSQRVKDGVDDLATVSSVTRLPAGFRIRAAVT